MRSSNIRGWTSFRLRSCAPRWYSARQRPWTKTIEVPVGGNGHVQIEILPPQALSSPSKILLYLPHGTPASRDGTDGPSDRMHASTILSSLLPNFKIITLKYRLSPPTRVFPLPIHDTVLAFNHILRTFTNHAPLQISLLGPRIGGTLATTLALTHPNSIHSVAVSEPIVDWVSLDSGNESDQDIPDATTKKPKSNHQYTSTDAESLLTLRSQIFPKPENYFDPFASPTLFLRAPGRDCPQPYSDTPKLTGGEAFGPYDDDHAHPHPHFSSPSPSSSSAEDQDAPILRPIKRRKVLRRWPPNQAPEGVQFPYFRVFVGDDRRGEGLVLRQQGEELVELVRRVCFYGWDREVVEGRVGLEVRSVTEEEGGMLGVEEGARWLARMHGSDG